MPRIDAHQHYWRYRPQHYPWIDERMSVLRQDFDPPRLRPLLQEQVRRRAGGAGAPERGRDAGPAGAG